MKRLDIVKGFLMKPIFEVIKKEHNLKSPTPSSLIVRDLGDDKYSVIYDGQKVYVDFSNTDLIKNLLVDIKNNPIYESLSV